MVGFLKSQSLLAYKNKKVTLLTEVICAGCSLAASGPGGGAWDLAGLPHSVCHLTPWSLLFTVHVFSVDTKEQSNLQKNLYSAFLATPYFA